MKSISVKLRHEPPVWPFRELLMAIMSLHVRQETQQVSWVPHKNHFAMAQELHKKHAFSESVAQKEAMDLSGAQLEDVVVVLLLVWCTSEEHTRISRKRYLGEIFYWQYENVSSVKVFISP